MNKHNTLFKSITKTFTNTIKLPFNPSISQCHKRFSSNRSTSGLDSQVTAVLGAQWGDEGKGKLVDILAQNYDICARFNGGSNAGHTLVVDGQKFAMHLLPCGVLNKHVINVIGNGVVAHIPTLMSELQNLLDVGISYEGRIKISDRAHIVFDFHQEVDGLLESIADHHQSTGKSQQGSIGTTRRGIGPTYASKMYRNGIRFGELKNWNSFKDRYLRLVEINQMKFSFEYNAQEELQRFQKYRELLLPMIDDTILYVNQEYDNGKKILLEGANAALLDIDFGTYPMVTASNTTHGAISTGLGLASPYVDTRVGVVKAYTTRVGYGPFPTEQLNDVGKHLIRVGHEYGTTTGRERRCGWIDIPLIQYSNLLNAYSSINITKLDVLDELDTLQIGKTYKINGQPLKQGSMPSTMDELSKIEVEYETLPGWKEDISKCQKYDDLPENAKKYLNRIEELCGIPITWVGVGPGRLEMVGKGFEF